MKCGLELKNLCRMVQFKRDRAKHRQYSFSVIEFEAIPTQYTPLQAAPMIQLIKFTIVTVGGSVLL
jgi:hypothetical protein